MIETDLEDPRLVGMLAAWADGVTRSRIPNEVIERHGSAYIERWFLGRKITVPRTIASRSRESAIVDDPTPMPTEIENLYLHRYRRNDFEDQHCHPWPNGSLIIRGYLIEDTPEGQRVHMPGDIILRRAEQRHAIIEVDPGTLTLFATGQKEREWGFWPEVGGVPTFVHHRDYRQWKIDHGLEHVGSSYGGGK